MIIGIHCSVIDGFLEALRNASRLGCEALQILPYRRHHEPSEEEICAFIKERAQSPVRRLIIHSRFVPSLASGSSELRSRSIALLAHELSLAQRWGAEAFVLHAGAYSPGGDLRQGVQLFVDSVVKAISQSGADIALCLENVPGGGRRMGGSLEELSLLFNPLKERLSPAGVCLDTAHAWSAGYDIASAEAMLRFLSRVHRLIGAQNVKVFHLNDTRAFLGSHRENHANWGEGYLGAEGLRVLLQRPEYSSILGILETPMGQDNDRRNLGFVRAIL